MAGRQGFITNHETYVYQEAPALPSAAFGLDSQDSHKWKLIALQTDNALPTGRCQIEIDSQANGSISFLPNGTGALVADSISDNAVARDIDFRKMRTTGTNIVTGDAMGTLKFKGYAPTSGYVTAASISSTSSGTIANNRVAGNLVFATHPDSASGLTPTTRMTIAPTGEVTIAAPDSGTAFTISNGGMTVSAGSTTITPLAAATAGIVTKTTTGVLGAIENTANDGYLLISKADASNPIWAALTAGANISITPGANSITIAAASPMTWSREAATPVNMVVNHGYIPTGGALTTFLLPATAALGDIIEIIGESAFNWTIAQNANQAIQFGILSTTVGVGGSLASTNAYDCVTLKCRVSGANTRWSVVSNVGVLNVV